jgi:hypothetical protein
MKPGVKFRDLQDPALRAGCVSLNSFVAESREVDGLVRAFDEVEKREDSDEINQA